MAKNPNKGSPGNTKMILSPRPTHTIDKYKGNFRAA
jgi:hypothetical protein